MELAKRATKDGIIFNSSVFFIYTLESLFLFYMSWIMSELMLFSMRIKNFMRKIMKFI